MQAFCITYRRRALHYCTVDVLILLLAGAEGQYDIRAGEQIKRIPQDVPDEMLTTTEALDDVTPEEEVDVAHRVRS